MAKKKATGTQIIETKKAPNQSLSSLKLPKKLPEAIRLAHKRLEN